MSSIGHCDHDLRQVLLGNVVLTGGGSMLSGFADRLSAELQRNVSHVSANAVTTNIVKNTRLLSRSRSMRQATPPNVGMVGGLEAASLPVLVHSTSCGSARRNGRYDTLFR